MKWIRSLWLWIDVAGYWHPHRTDTGKVMRRRVGNAVEYREMTEAEAADDAAWLAIR